MSVPRLKACPNPKCTDHAVSMAVFRVYRVCCEGCGMEGPMAMGLKTRTEAAQLWNLLPRREQIEELEQERDAVCRERDKINEEAVARAIRMDQRINELTELVEDLVP